MKTKSSLNYTNVCQLFFILLVLVGFMGCRTADKAYIGTVSMTNPDRLKIDTKLKWIKSNPRIRPTNADKMTIYSRFRNTSGDEIDVTSDIEREIEKLGYRFVNNIDDAQYYLRTDLRYYGENAQKNSSNTILGAIAGGIAGAAIGHNVGTNNTGYGAAGGAAIGAMSGNIVTNRNKNIEIGLVLDVTIGERIKGGVDTSRGNEQESQMMHHNADEGGGRLTGHTKTNSSEEQSLRTKDDFLYHENRLVTSCNRLNLTLAEAEPILRKKLSTAIASILP